MGFGHDRKLAHCIRALAVDAVESAQSGHPGMPMGMADAALVLYAKHLKFAPSVPAWPDRDRFILSNGHGSMLQYALLHLTGYPDMTMDQLRSFRQHASLTPGHPEYGHTPGVDATTGPLGQGLAMAVGKAIAERKLAAEFGAELVDHRTWAFAGDGCLMEGVGQEAISLAGHLGLDKLIVVFDDNRTTIDGNTELARTEDIKLKMQACNWRVLEADGHDLDAIDAAFEAAREGQGKPVFIALRTQIGYGAPNKANTSAAHGSPLGTDEAAASKKAWGWEHGPFEVPDDLLAKWRSFAQRGEEKLQAWQERLSASERKHEFGRRTERQLPADFADTAKAKRVELASAKQEIATRKASQQAIGFWAERLPELIGGSADLTGSNLTHTAGMEAFSVDSPSGRYLYFGVREFAMCAAVNGMFLHGGLRPYGGTFLTFSDYARNAIRMAALMHIGSIFVMTHDSIGLGEDGPTHQPIEHLASLRAIPNLNVFRPADAVETFECWELALASTDTPSLLALTRQGTKQYRTAGDENLSARGAYVLREPGGKRDVTFLATGSEVQLAVEAAEALAKDGINAAVVSMPCWELFDAQSASYRKEVLGSARCISIEAASSFGWGRYIKTEDDHIGMVNFGESAPAKGIYQRCNITAEHAADLAKSILANQ